VPEVRIAAEPRTEFGKGPARRTRRDGRVPAVLYGHHSEPRHVTLPGHEVLLALRTANVLIRLEGLPGGAQLALPKAVQRDPIKGYVEHVDLLLVRRGEKVTVDVPVNVIGEVTPEGLLDQQLIQISVEAEATHIPPGIDVNVEGMVVGDAVHAGDLKLPSGVTLAEEPDILVLHVITAPTAAQIEAELGEAEAEAGVGAPAEAAPAAPAAAAGGEGPAEAGGEGGQPQASNGESA
jgi:large subunit ribosomal protein L25